MYSPLSSRLQGLKPHPPQRQRTSHHVSIAVASKKWRGLESPLGFGSVERSRGRKQRTRNARRKQRRGWSRKTLGSVNLLTYNRVSDSRSANFRSNDSTPIRPGKTSTNSLDLTKVHQGGVKKAPSSTPMSKVERLSRSIGSLSCLYNILRDSRISWFARAVVLG